MAYEDLIEVDTRGQGTYDITADVARIVRAAGILSGIAHVFALHTSCSVVITENADPAVCSDLERLARRWAPQSGIDYAHDTEGADDMPAHARSILAGVSVTVPVSQGRLLLGTWQGIYLWEHRTHAQARRVQVSVVG